MKLVKSYSRAGYDVCHIRAKIVLPTAQNQKMTMQHGHICSLLSNRFLFKNLLSYTSLLDVRNAFLGKSFFLKSIHHPLQRIDLQSQIKCNTLNKNFINSRIWLRKYWLCKNVLTFCLKSMVTNWSNCCRRKLLVISLDRCYDWQKWLCFNSVLV